jgi:hypothetical protein
MWTTTSFRLRKLPQPFRLGAVEESAIRTVAVGGRHRNRLRAALADHLLDNGPTVLFERVCVGHQRELAGIAIPDLQVFVVKGLERVAGADFEQVPRKPFHLAAIAGEAEGYAFLARPGHGVFQIVKLPIADQVLSVGLREWLFWIVEASLRHLGREPGADRVTVGIDDCSMFRSVQFSHGSLL